MVVTMHELGITKNIVSIVSGYAKGARVKRVSLEIGKLSAVVPDAIRFCFDVCAQGTELENADLEIIEIAGRKRCRDCQLITETSQVYGPCECGSWDTEPVSGEELRVKEMELL
jgi:hydrogenase nickel incorporation protein HypA/HybF